jgi:hypothetical protein
MNGAAPYIDLNNRLPKLMLEWMHNQRRWERE